MQYFGGKAKISGPLSKFLNNELECDQPFVDLFCGSCNVISKIDDNRLRYANDINPYLIEMFKSLMNNYEFPDNITEEQYKYVKDNKDEDKTLTSFVGFGCSFAGYWFTGYARDHNGRNYAKNAKNSLLKKKALLNNVVFSSFDYKDFKIPCNSLIYCDIPYRGKTQYSKSVCGIFNHDEFYDWVRKHSNSHNIYISEYKENIPDCFDVVWEYKSKRNIRDKNNVLSPTVEVLIKFNN